MKIKLHYLNFFKALILALLSALIFTIVGITLPDIYYRHFDNTIYYCLENPDLPQTNECNDNLPNVKLDKKSYSPCDTVIITARRYSQIDSRASVLRVLYELKKIDEVDTTIVTTVNATNNLIRKGTDIVSVKQQLPCDIEEGYYYFRTAVQFEVRGIERNYYWQSSNFKVVR